MKGAEGGGKGSMDSSEARATTRGRRTSRRRGAGLNPPSNFGDRGAFNSTRTGFIAESIVPSRRQRKIRSAISLARAEQKWFPSGRDFADPKIRIFKLTANEVTAI